MRHYVCLSKSKDKDLLRLYAQVGEHEFRKLAIDALHAAVKNWYKPKVAKPSVISGVYAGESINVGVCISDDDINDILSYCRKGEKSGFIKGALRFYLGRRCILGTYLGNERRETSLPKPCSRSVKRTDPDINTRRMEPVPSGSKPSHTDPVRTDTNSANSSEDMMSILSRMID